MTKPTLDQVRSAALSVAIGASLTNIVLSAVQQRWTQLTLAAAFVFALLAAHKVVQGLITWNELRIETQRANLEQVKTQIAITHAALKKIEEAELLVEVEHPGDRW